MLISLFIHLFNDAYSFNYIQFIPMIAPLDFGVAFDLTIVNSLFKKERGTFSDF